MHKLNICFEEFFFFFGKVDIQGEEMTFQYKITKTFSSKNTYKSAFYGPKGAKGFVLTMYWAWA